MHSQQMPFWTATALTVGLALTQSAFSHFPQNMPEHQAISDESSVFSILHERCAPHFGGPHCQDCLQGYDGPDCQQCEQNFTGPDCDECKGHHTGDGCAECDPGYGGPNCELILD